MALVGDQRRFADTSAVKEDLQEFFGEETDGFLSRLQSHLSAPSSGGGRHDDDDDDDDDNGDRSFKHKRARESDDDDRDASARDVVGGGGSDERPAKHTRHHRDAYQSHQNDFRQDYRARPNHRDGGGRRGRCRDYFDKGFCMRGDLCPYSHEEQQAPGSDRRNNGNGYGGNRMPFSGMPNMPNMPNMPMGADGSFDPAMFQAMQQAFAMNPEMMQMMQGNMMGGGGMPMRGGRGGMRGGRGRGRGGRGGYDGGYHSMPQQPLEERTMIDVANIPPEHQTVTSVNDYFKRFGTLVNVNLHGNRATVQFSTHDEAAAAKDSPEAIFDNRFVKVYWHNPMRQQQQQQMQQHPSQGYNARPPRAYHQQDGYPQGDEAAAAAAAAGMADPTQQAQAPQQAHSNEPDPELVAARLASMNKLIAAKDKQRKEQMKVLLDLQKKQEQMLQDHIQRQKDLFAQLDNKALAPAEKEDLFKKLKLVSAEMDAARLASQQELLAKVAQLRKEAKTLGIEPPTIPPELFATYTAAVRNASTPSTAHPHHVPGAPAAAPAAKRSLDNRPTTLLVQSPADAPLTDEELKAHFAQFGHLAAWDTTEQGHLARFSQRFEAEKAMSLGAEVRGTKLTLTWHTNT
ncbi:hypothetical protein BC940DRAFT_316950 [Gongronella butleri]|nr:hypothetical protein BC940DRAFT_316950 [Gongronella butleri]